MKNGERAGVGDRISAHIERGIILVITDKLSLVRSFNLLVSHLNNLQEELNGASAANRGLRLVKEVGEVVVALRLNQLHAPVVELHDSVVGFLLVDHGLVFEILAPVNEVGRNDENGTRVQEER